MKSHVLVTFFSFVVVASCHGISILPTEVSGKKDGHLGETTHPYISCFLTLAGKHKPGLIRGKLIFRKQFKVEYCTLEIYEGPRFGTILGQWTLAGSKAELGTVYHFSLHRKFLSGTRFSILGDDPKSSGMLELKLSTIPVR